MIKRILVPLALLVSAALAIATCGGGGSGDEDKITEAIEKVATTGDPSNCTELETQRFDEQNSQRSGKDALAACEAEAEAGKEVAQSADVSNVSVDGDKATAEVALEGGSLGSQALELALVEDGGQWKLDFVEGFAKYDGKALGEAFRREFEANPEGLSEDQADCISREIAKQSQPQAEELFFSGSPQAIIELAKGCA